MKVEPLPGDIAGHFLSQAKSCEMLGSPFTANLCRLIGINGVPDGAVHQRLSSWGGAAANRDALALRLAGGLHFLVLAGKASDLAALFPPNEYRDDVLFDRASGAILAHERFLERFLDSPPQTNETARSAVLLPGFLLLAQRHALPLVTSEIGSSAGLNQNWQRFHYDYGSWKWGDADSPLRLQCEWRGAAPPGSATLEVAESEGCDIAPVDIASPEDRLRLKSYVWPDQQARLERLDGALRVAEDHPPKVAREPAAAWLDKRLSLRFPGRLHVMFHTIMWQYMAKADRTRIRFRLTQAGDMAGADAPLAWLRFEADDDRRSAGLYLTTWSGAAHDGETKLLARGDFHGRWIEWRGWTDGAAALLEPG